MRSALRCFSRFALSLIFCFAITTPKIALADWRPYENGISWVYNVPGLPPTLKVTPKHDSGKHSYSTIIETNVNGNYGSRDYPVWNNKPSGNFCNMLMMPVSGSVLGAGTKFKVLNGNTVPYIYANSSSPSATDYEIGYVTALGIQYWVLNTANSDPRQIFPDSNGVLTAPYNVGTVFLNRYLAPGQLSVGTSGLWNTYEDMHLVVYYPEDFNEVEAIEQQTVEIGQQTQQQTNTLMNVDGAGGVLDGANGVTNTINSKLGFVAQSASMVTSLYDAILGQDAATTVRFPGIQFGTYVIASPQDVPLLGWMPEVENTARLMITGVFVLAWISGVRRLYGKFFLGEQEVIIDGDEG